ncbi:hypothetical protein [Xenophilus sp. Marseille-Q4582]|uniref:hypothetical protein n=1 Tax=Xenophilus sp. Marseille-Q4582 TaxID=2866600 RepID=UPI001CE42622|nr:hypothetical protein [Xenophilus sp. Marseille-Q4582]
MTIIPPWVKWAAAVVIAGASFAAGWHLNGMTGRAAVAEVKTELATGRADRAEAARTDEQKTATLEHQHAGLTLAAAERFSLAAPGRELALRAELADARRVRDGAEVRAARYRAQAQGDAAARRDLADRCEALDRQLAAGVGVVAALRGDLERRDAEVMLLVEQIQADRLLFAVP